MYVIAGVIGSVIAAGVKGLMIPFNPISPNGTNWRKNWFGWTDPRMAPHWKRLGSAEPLSHTLTNLIVEWFEMDKESLRRGVKMTCGVILIQWLLLAITFVL